MPDHDVATDETPVAAPTPALRTPAAGGLSPAVLTPARVRALQRSVGNRATGRILARYQIEGPWNYNDPVHEVLTLVALSDAITEIRAGGGTPGPLLAAVNTARFPQRTDAQGHNISPAAMDLSAHQFIRGVDWPDDPQSLMFDSPADATNYSSGLAWYSEFHAGEQGQQVTEPSHLIRRSHFGDLQFFHGMASADGETATDTKARIMAWADMLAQVATGALDSNTRLAAIPTANRLFPAHRQATVKQLFGFGAATDLQARQRAAGALLHLVQDSHARGHVQRDAANDIVEFHSYTHQSHDRHGADDAWGAGRNLGERISHTGGAALAITRCSRVLVLLDQGHAAAVVSYLDSEVFRLAANVHASGPGAAYRR